MLRQNYVEINLSNFIHNLSELAKLHKDKKILPVIKSNAYGHGLIEIANTISNLKLNIPMVCVLSTEEGVLLRQNKFNKKILVLGSPYPYEENFKEMIKNSLTPTISSIDELKHLKEIAKKLNKQISFHLKIDTGMHRLGLLTDQLDKFMENYSENYKNVFIEGLFTHLSSADSDPEFTGVQINRLKNVIEKIKKYGIKPTIIHAANSSASILYKDAHFDALRPGIALYGLLPFKNATKYINLKPVLSWKTKIVLLKKIKKNQPISYGQTFITKRDSIIAVAPVGYADGYSRLLSNKGYALIRSKKSPIRGRVTMDMTMFDVTDIKDVKVGDEVVLIGTQKDERITAEELADLIGTINYEIACKIHPRVKRIYI